LFTAPLGAIAPQWVIRLLGFSQIAWLALAQEVQLRLRNL
jgi:hypothetical protein